MPHVFQPRQLPKQCNVKSIITLEDWNRINVSSSELKRITQKSKSNSVTRTKNCKYSKVKKQRVNYLP